MGKIKMETGVVVMKLTATVYRGTIREIQSSRIGFCGEYNKEILSKMGDEFKKIFAKQIEAEYKGKSVKPDKIIYRVSTKSTECEASLYRRPGRIQEKHCAAVHVEPDGQSEGNDSQGV